MSRECLADRNTPLLSGPKLDEPHYPSIDSVFPFPLLRKMLVGLVGVQVYQLSKAANRHGSCQAAWYRSLLTDPPVANPNSHILQEGLPSNKSTLQKTSRAGSAISSRLPMRSHPQYRPPSQATEAASTYMPFCVCVQGSSQR
jgi:hypothetical protein